jgi:hypothetical protein
MDATEDLFLTEEVALLALRSREGTVEPGAWFRVAIAGAILAELILRGRVDVPDRKTDVTVLDDAPVGDPVIDSCLAAIEGSEQSHSARFWLARFIADGDLRHRVARGLAARGILRAIEEKVALVFTSRTYPEVDPEPELKVHDRLYAAIFDDDDDPSPRTIVLLSIAHHTGLLTANFAGQLDPDRTLRVEVLIDAEVPGELTRELVQATGMARRVLSSFG